MNNPKISIIIPCFNGSNFVGKALHTALEQTYKNKEVIFVDNESTDNSLLIAKEIKADFPELIVTTAKNIYPHCWDEPRTKGFELATGEHLFTLAADDYEIL